MGISTTVRGQGRQARTVDGEILRMLARSGTPASLSVAELALDTRDVTRPAHAIPVWAWVRYDGTPVRVQAELCGWTSHACAVRWSVPGLGVHRAWVFVGAVEERPAPAGGVGSRP